MLLTCWCFELLIWVWKWLLPQSWDLIIVHQTASACPVQKSNEIWKPDPSISYFTGVGLQSLHTSSVVLEIPHLGFISHLIEESGGQAYHSLCFWLVTQLAQSIPVHQLQVILFILREAHHFVKQNMPKLIAYTVSMFLLISDQNDSLKNFLWEMESSGY